MRAGAVAALAVLIPMNHLLVQIASFDARLVPHLQSSDPHVWTDYAQRLATDPVAASQYQFDFPSRTSNRELQVTWALTCTPNGPPDVDHISYDFRVGAREAGSDRDLHTGSILTTSPTGTHTVSVPAGEAVWLTRHAHCGGSGVGPSSGGIHGSNTIDDHGDVIVIPPYVPLPVLMTPVRTQQRAGKHPVYRTVSATAIPRGSRIFVVPGVVATPSADHALRIVLDGAGVHVEKTITSKTRVVLTFTAARAGTIRYWAELDHASSNVVLLKVR